MLEYLCVEIKYVAEKVSRGKDKFGHLFPTLRLSCHSCWFCCTFGSCLQAKDPKEPPETLKHKSVLTQPQTSNTPSAEEQNQSAVSAGSTYKLQNRLLLQKKLT